MVVLFSLATLCNAPDANTPLIMAAEGEYAICEALLAHGASVDLQNRNGISALIAAVKYTDARAVTHAVWGASEALVVSLTEACTCAAGTKTRRLCRR